MRALATSALALALLPLACTRGSGVPGSEVRSVEAFGAVDVRGAMTVEVEIGPPIHVEVSGDDNVVPKVRTELSGESLVVDLPGAVSTELPLVVRITTPTLHEIDLGGASKGEVTGIGGERFEADVSGASTLELTGEVATLDADVSGASKLRAAGLTAKTADIEAEGASSAEVRATEVLDADASGASKIRYHGDPPTIHQDASGSSTIEPAG